jgi:hypothetical protein
MQAPCRWSSEWRMRLSGCACAPLKCMSESLRSASNFVPPPASYALFSDRAALWLGLTLNPNT